MTVPYIYDNVQDTSTTTGTGTLTLANSAPTGRQTFGAATGNTNKLVRYSIVHQSANEWENGIGTYTHSGTTLSRTTILSSSNSGAAVSLSAGTKDVFIAPMAAFPRSILVDLNGVSTIIDDDTADTLIAATSKPGSPQYTKTILAGDIPSNENVEDWAVLFSIGGKNNDVATRVINWRFTLNGTDIGTGDTSVSPTTGTPFWIAAGLYQTAALAANDVLGVKLWSDVTNQVDYRGVSIYIIPRRIIPAFGQLLFPVNDTTFNRTLAGAVSGATYTTQILNPGYHDANVNFYEDIAASAGDIRLGPLGSNAQHITCRSNGNSAPVDLNNATATLNSVYTLRGVSVLRYLTGMQF